MIGRFKGVNLSCYNFLHANFLSRFALSAPSANLYATILSNMQYANMIVPVNINTIMTYAIMKFLLAFFVLFAICEGCAAWVLTAATTPLSPLLLAVVALLSPSSSLRRRIAVTVEVATTGEELAIVVPPRQSGSLVVVAGPVSYHSP